MYLLYSEKLKGCFSVLNPSSTEFTWLLFNGMSRAPYMKHENANSTKPRHAIGLVAATLCSDNWAYDSSVFVWMLEKQ